MVERKIIVVEQEKCDGCGQCLPNCPEGALKIVNGKLQITEGLCDGLGACVGTCPKGALQVVEKETETFNLQAALTNIKKLERFKPKKAKEQIEHLKKGGFNVDSTLKQLETHDQSTLSQWPIKLELVNPNAPFLKGSELLVVADCVPFANRNFHQDFLLGKKIVTGCPKFGNINLYLQKLSEILKNSEPKRLEVIRMEVPCCGGLKYIAEEAVKDSGADTRIKVEESIIGINGRRLVNTREAPCHH